MIIKPPKFLYEDWAKDNLLHPHATQKEKDLWWGREEERWIEGAFGLVGTHYFALTQGTIKTAYGKRIRPVWRDLDEELIYPAYHEAERTSHDLLITKRREAGLSVIFGGIMPVYKSFTLPGGTCLLTSADKDRMSTLFKDKTRVCYDSFDPYYKPSVVSTREGHRLHMGVLDRKTGEVTGLDSKIICEETVMKPDAFEAYRATYIFLDEFFLHPKADKVLRSSQASVKTGFRKIAPIVMGGSAGEATLEGHNKGKEIWQNAEALKVIIVFLPATKGIMEAPELDSEGKETGKILNFCPNGHSDEKSAEEWIFKTRDNLDKLSNKTYLETFIKQYPLTIDEVFSGINKGSFPEDVINNLKTQERIILTTPPPVIRFNLFEDADGKINEIPKSDGDFLVLRKPIAGHDYIAGIDPIPFNSDDLNNGSNHCTAIKDLDTNAYVAILSERAIDPHLIVRKSSMLQKWYFNAKAMVEKNRGGVLINTYKDYGLTHLLAPKPTVLGKGFKPKDGEFGFHKGEESGERINAALIEYFRKYSDEVWFMEVIQEAYKYLVDNTDIIDAMGAAELYHKAIVTKFKKKVEGDKKRLIRVLENRNGKMVYVWKEIIC
jgi:hypothetical protein